MNDFIEKPSRMILFIVGIIALITIIILLSRSGMINTGGESLVDAQGRTLVTKAPENPAAGSGTAAGTEDAGYEEVYVEDDYDNYGEEVWAEEPGDAGEAYTEVPETQTEEPVNEEPSAEEPTTEETYEEPEETGEDEGYEEEPEETEEDTAEIWDEVTE